MPYIDGLPAASMVLPTDLLVLCQGSTGVPGSGTDAKLPMSTFTSGLAGVASFNARFGEVTLNSADVTNALTYTPYDRSNPFGFQTGADVAAAITASVYVLPTASTSVLGGVRVDGTTVTVSGAGVISTVASAVTSVAGRTGAVVLTGSDITGALTYTPYNAANPTGYQTAANVSALITAAAYVLPTASTTVLGGVKVDGVSVTIASGVISASGVASGVASFNTRLGAVTLSSADVTAALTFTPYNATNPTGYQTAAQVGTSIAAAAYSLPIATASVLGGVKPDGTTLANTAGAISVTYGTTAATAAAGNDSRITGALAATTAASTYLTLSGGTLTGALTLSGAPTVPLNAASKGYVDAAVIAAGGAPAASTATPLINGTGAPGTAIPYSREDHVHPTDTTRYAASNPTGYQTAANVSSSITAAASSATPLINGTAAVGVTTTFARGDHIHPTDTTRYAAANPSGFQTAANVTSAITAVASSTTPVIDGTATVGVGTTYARADHIHPTDTSRYAATNPSGFQSAAQVSIAVGAAASITAPLADGTATVGVGTTYARADHVHPTTAAPGVAVTLGASPFIYTAPSHGSVLISGGGVTRLEIQANGLTYYQTGCWYGAFPVASGSKVRLTYIGSPSMTFIPT